MLGHLHFPTKKTIPHAQWSPTKWNPVYNGIKLLQRHLQRNPAKGEAHNTAIIIAIDKEWKEKYSHEKHEKLVHFFPFFLHLQEEKPQRIVGGPSVK